MPRGLYVYTVMSREASLPAITSGFDGAALASVPWLSLAGIVSPVASTELRPTPANLLHHEKVVETLRLAGPLLPVRFGTILPDESAVARAIADHYTALVADLTRLGDKVELGLMVLWDTKDVGNADAIEAAAADRAIITRLPASGPGTSYLKARMKEYWLEESLRSKARELAKDLDDTLSAHVLEWRYILLPTARLALSAAYLLEPSQVDAFRETFEKVRRFRSDLRLMLSGPWPPYSFVTLPNTEVPVTVDKRVTSLLATAISTYFVDINQNWSRN